VANLIGLQYIAETFHTEYKSIAEQIGVSQQSLQDWLKGRRKIPMQRLEQLSRLFGIKDLELFQRELSDSEKIDIQILYFQHTDIFEEIEEPYIDEDGREHTVTHSYSQNRGIIEFLHEKSEEAKLMENVRAVVDSDNADSDANRTLIEQALTVMDGTPSERRTLELVLYFLAVHQKDEWWGVHPHYTKYHENGFFDKFRDLLNEFGLLNEKR
jgi:transcriptional regulator with XRE-family HTH domain